MATQTKRKSVSERGKATRQTTRRRRSRKPRFQVAGALPQGIVQVEFIRKAAERIDEIEQITQLAESLEDGYQELRTRMESLEENARGRLDQRWGHVQEMLDSVRERVLESRAGQTLSDLPDRATTELDELLDRMGLMRKSLHEDEISVLRKRQKAARKAAATRRRKAAERA